MTNCVVVTPENILKHLIKNEKQNSYECGKKIIK